MEKAYKIVPLINRIRVSAKHKFLGLQSPAIFWAISEDSTLPTLARALHKFPFDTPSLKPQ